MIKISTFCAYSQTGYHKDIELFLSFFHVLTCITSSWYLSNSCESVQRRRFQPAFEVGSTQRLVKIYNNHASPVLSKVYTASCCQKVVPDKKKYYKEGY